MRSYFFLAGILMNSIVIAQNNTGGNTEGSAIKILVNPEKTYQRIEHFGASDAWACQFAGNWPAAKKNAIADWLFSTDTLSDGSPKGIGLSLWRFNIGGGSIQQKESSGINDEWRRAESFLNEKGKLDFSLQSGQRWFLQAAKDRGVANFLGFVNSPPVQFTRTGKAFAQSAEGNLAPGSYQQYAEYLAATIQGIQQTTGVLFNYISPVNEPQNDWSDGGQEGSPYQNHEIYDIAKTLNQHFLKKKISTRLVFPEAFEIKYLLAEYDKPGRGNQIASLFTKSSSQYLGSLNKVDKVIAYHSYLSSSPNHQAKTIRKELAERVADLDGFRLWQSEYCVLGNNAGDLEGSGKDLGIKTALYVANLIHNDLVYANVTAWHWWLAVSPYDYKDGLVYIDKNRQDGNYADSKLLWAFGNYSRFVRPGMLRIEASSDQPEEKLTLSAYTNAEKQETVLIITNRDNETISVEINQGSQDNLLSGYEYYTTSSQLKLKKEVLQGKRLTIPAESIVSIVIRKSAH